IPGVVLCGMTAVPHHGVDRGLAPEHHSAGNTDSPAIDLRLRHIIVASVIGAAADPHPYARSVDIRDAVAERPSLDQPAILTGLARYRRENDPPGGGVRRRPADRLIALIVPDHDEQVFRLFVAKRSENAKIEDHTAVGIKRDNATVRQADRQSEGLGRDAAK